MSLFEILYSLLSTQFKPAYVVGFTQYDEDGYPTDNSWEDEDEEDDETYDDDDLYSDDYGDEDEEDE